MAVQDLMRVTLAAGLGLILLVGLAKLVWFSLASEFANRRRLRDQGKATRVTRRRQGAWIQAGREAGPADPTPGNGTDVYFVYDGKFLKGFVPPDREGAAKRKPFRGRKAFPGIEP